MLQNLPLCNFHRRFASPEGNHFSCLSSNRLSNHVITVSQTYKESWSTISTNGKFLVGLFLIKNCNVIWPVTESVNNSRQSQMLSPKVGSGTDSNCSPNFAKYSIVHNRGFLKLLLVLTLSSSPQ